MRGLAPKKERPTPTFSAFERPPPARPGLCVVSLFSSFFSVSVGVAAMACTNRRNRATAAGVAPLDIESLLADLPLSRVAAAFERPAVGVVRSLFALCLRALVPFAAVDALVQSRLPCGIETTIYASARSHGLASFEAEVNGDGGASGDKRIVAGNGGQGKSRDGPSHAFWWVSCCGCLRRLATDAAPRYDADATGAAGRARAVGSGACPRATPCASSPGTGRRSWPQGTGRWPRANSCRVVASTSATGSTWRATRPSGTIWGRT
ncbi:hypothetical protein TW95_gp1270 [Pandoravirus inopinatum]|uniref:Uncharacterized protein n=1 Tax=Pandoravirus inopinatum TaxID=1605721 RepID=A0A0B5J337_9VIRU|nr:hypothetical protein TW95_gp1270 [Pandoravirus inopinatum]AJF98004.1 hypothetical protein [Pandoravirus inopinatum]